MRLIDADALPVQKVYSVDEAGFGANFYMVDKKDIDNAPTIDAKPVVNGEIIEIIENGKMKRVFSCCNAACTQLTMWINPNYCPNCGAKMDGGKET